MLAAIALSLVVSQIDANFTASPNAGANPLTVSFTDTSTGADSILWVWDFGDGPTSFALGPNPSHTYFAPGTYTVSLTVKGDDGSVDLRTKVDLITVNFSLLVPDFSADSTQGSSPLTVQFTDTSVGPVTAWRWNFGDGHGSSLQNPTHTYLVAGTYSVNLTVFVGQQFGTKHEANLIVVTPDSLVADFSASPTQRTNPLTVDFIDTSTLQDRTPLDHSPESLTVSLEPTRSSSKTWSPRTPVRALWMPPSPTHRRALRPRSGSGMDGILRPAAVNHLHVRFPSMML